MPTRLAKLTRPALHGALARTRLFSRLDESGNRPLLFVVGPPGAGKTTLIVSWLDTRKLPVIWYQVDAGDADVASFFHYFGMSVAPLEKSRSRMPVFSSDYRHDIAGFSRRYFRTLGENLPRHSVIVLDNFQDAGPAAQMHQVLAVAIAELPPDCRLLIISREEHPEAFSRLVANRMVCTIDWEDLRLSAQETREIVETSHPHLKGSAAFLHEQAQGWVGGLILMLEQAAQTNEVEAVNGVDTREQTFHYFATQIFSRADIDDRLFMMRSAFLPRTTVAMAAALTGDALAGLRLADLHKRRLFIHRREGVEAHFVFHVLFRQFLLSQAETQFEPAEIASLWAHSGRILEQSSDWEDAVEAHARGAQWQALQSLIERHAPHLIAQGRSATLRRWIGRLPEARIRQSAWMLHWLASAIALEDPMAALPEFERAHRLFVEAGDPGGQIATLCGIVETIFFAATNHAMMDPWIPLLKASMSRIGRYPAIELELRAHAALLLASLFRAPEPVALEQIARRTLALLDSAAPPNQRMTAAIFLMIYCTFTGQFVLAEVVQNKADAMVVAGGIAPHNLGVWSVWKSYLAQILFLPESGIAQSGEAEAIGREHGLSHIVFLARYFRSGIEARKGDLASAEKSVAVALASVNPARRLQVAQGNACSAWLAVYTNKAELAVEHGRLAMSVARELGSPSYLIHYGLPYLFGLVEVGEIDEACRVLAEQREAISGTAIACFTPLLDCAEARILEKSGNQLAARTIVSRMWPLARSQDHGRYLSWLAPWMPRFAAWALEEHVESDYVSQLARHYRWKPSEDASDRWPWPVRIYTLGSFEVFIDGHALQFGRKSPKKPLAMLKAIVAAGGSEVSESRLADMLWPDQEGDVAGGSFDITLHRLRKWLKHADAIRQKGNRISLNPERCWVDAWHFERSARMERVSNDVMPHYRGSFLPQDAEAPWILAYRDRLRNRFVQLVSARGKALESAGQLDQAIALYLRGIEADELVEPFYQGLMRAYGRLDRVPEAIGTYRRLRQTLSVTLGVQPAPASEQLYRSLHTA